MPVHVGSWKSYHIPDIMFIKPLSWHNEGFQGHLIEVHIQPDCGCVYSSWNGDQTIRTLG